MHARTHTRTHTHTYAHARTRICTSTHTRALACTHSTHTHAHARTAHIRARTHARTHARAHTHTLKRTHARTHTRTHTHQCVHWHSPIIGGTDWNKMILLQKFRGVPPTRTHGCSLLPLPTPLPPLSHPPPLPYPSHTPPLSCNPTPPPSSLNLLLHARPVPPNPILHHAPQSCWLLFCHPSFYIRNTRLLNMPPKRLVGQSLQSASQQVSQSVNLSSVLNHDNPLLRGGAERILAFPSA